MVQLRLPPLLAILVAASCSEGWPEAAPEPAAVSSLGTPAVDAGYEPEDADGDGWLAGVDCDDANPAVHPGATERCNGLDDDCDGLADDADPEGVADAAEWYRDEDGDGFGDDPVRACVEPPGTARVGGDCDDANPAVHPGAAEVCDGADDDCDGLVDDEDDDLADPGAEVLLRDGDGDGFGADGASRAWCEPPAGWSAAGGDCDDEDPAVAPGAVEVCDGVDDDCDGLVDEADPDLDPAELETFFADADGDGYGDPDAPVEACFQPSGAVADDTDCDDADAGVHPWAGDAFGDGLDEDCDGLDCEAGDAGSAYFVVCLSDVNWDTARWLCQDAGHDELASIRDAVEQAFVEDLLDAAGGWEDQAPWIGFTDQDSEGTWTWTDGWTGSYTNWNPGEPNSEGDEDCAHLNWRFRTGEWNDADCSLERAWGGFVCESR